MGVWTPRRVLWAVCVRFLLVLRPLAGRGVEVGVGCLGIFVGLWFVGGGRLLAGGSRRQELRLGGRRVVLGYSVWALVLLVRVHGPRWVFRGAWWPKCCGLVRWGRQVALDCVAVVVRVCRLHVVPWHRPERWQGLVGVVGVSLVYVMLRVWSSAPRGVGGLWHLAALQYWGSGGRGQGWRGPADGAAGATLPGPA